MSYMYHVIHVSCHTCIMSEVLSGGPDSFGGADTSVANVTRIVIEDEPVLLNLATSEMNNLETITD